MNEWLTFEDIHSMMQNERGFDAVKTAKTIGELSNAGLIVSRTVDTKTYYKLSDSIKSVEIMEGIQDA